MTQEQEKTLNTFKEELIKQYGYCSLEDEQFPYEMSKTGTISAVYYGGDTRFWITITRKGRLVIQGVSGQLIR